MITTALAEPPAKRTFDFLPVGLFGSVMGLTGLSVAWRLAASRYQLPTLLSSTLATLAALAFVLLAGAYLTKTINAPDLVRAEFSHPVAASLFGTVLISMLLLPIVIVSVLPALALVMWSAGAVCMVAFAWLIVDRWVSNRQQVAHATPTWLVPVVGLLDVPLAMPALGLDSLRPLMVFALSVGLFFAIPLFTMVFSRLVFDSPLPDALQPTLMILLAPFAVGTSTYIATTGQVDLFAKSLFALTLFVLAVLAGRMRYLAQCCPFRVGWWAVSFPLAAAAVSAFRIASAEQNWFYDSVAVLLLVLATSVVGWLLLRTIVGLARGDFRRLSS